MIKWTFYYSIGQGEGWSPQAEVTWSFAYDKDSVVRFEMLKWQYKKYKEQLKRDYGITWKPYRVEKRVG